MMLKLLLCLTIVVGATSASYIYEEKNVRIMDILRGKYTFGESIKDVVNCQNSRDKGPPEVNSARG